MAISKFEYISNLDSTLNSARREFEKVIWDAFTTGKKDATSPEFRGALFNYIFWLEDTIDQHFQVGFTKDRMDLNKWKRRRYVNQIGSNTFHFEEPGRLLLD